MKTKINDKLYILTINLEKITNISKNDLLKFLKKNCLYFKQKLILFNRIQEHDFKDNILTHNFKFENNDLKYDSIKCKSCSISTYISCIRLEIMPSCSDFKKFLNGPPGGHEWVSHPYDVLECSKCNLKVGMLTTTSGSIDRYWYLLNSFPFDTNIPECRVHKMDDALS